MKRKPKISALLAVLTAALLAATPSLAQIGGRPGAFSRMGFGARGVGMGNAMTAVVSGDIVSYYNPALIPWTDYRHAQASFGILSLDRSLNFLSYSQALPPVAGISAGIINAGVSKIDGRNSKGEPTGDLRTSENEVFLGFGAKFRPGFSIGINLKLLYYHLYTDISSTTVGLDIGALVPVNDALTLAATVRDLGSRYRWDTGTLYGQQGSTSEDPFPVLYTAGAAYRLPDSLGIVSAELEASDAKTLITRWGVEVPVIPELTLRGGIDRIDLKEKGNGIRPSFGFTARKQMPDWTPQVTYAFTVEPFSPSGMHIITLSVVF